MVHQISIAVIIALFIAFEVYVLGKKISLTNNLFINNESAVWSLGVATYLGCTFLAFLPFAWITPNIVYLIIIFVAKDFLIFSYIFVGKVRLRLASVDYQTVLFILLAALTILLFYNFVVQREIVPESESNRFNFFSYLWQWTQNVLSSVSALNLDFVKQWIVGFLALSVVVSAVSALVMRFSRQRNFWDYLISWVLAFLMVIFFNFNGQIESLLGVYLVPFLLLIALNIIQFSRKRYSFVFVIGFLVAWIIEHRLFITLSALSISVSLIYIFLKKPMPSLFFSQLMIPILVIVVSWLNFWIVYLLLVVLAVVYIIITVSKTTDLIAKINYFLQRNNRVIPVVFLVTILLIATLVLAFSQRSITDIAWEEHLVFDYQTFVVSQEAVGILKIVQAVIYALAILALVTVLIFWSILRTKIIHWRTGVVLVSLIFATAFNPLIYPTLSLVGLENNFTYLRSVTFVPLILIGLIKLRNWMYKTIEV
ncbi:hypothetical protein [Mycoplasma sp. ATU-Cv-703]|uniref:hypothetical protein n=1 Tax=Mycoplasma sp. ATU-Cv-703 TaxID=2498595 RepID=UPI000FDF6168